MKRLIRLTKESIEARARFRDAAREMAAIRGKIDARIRDINRRVRINNEEFLGEAAAAAEKSNSDIEHELLMETDTESSNMEELNERAPEHEDDSEMDN